MLNVICAYFNFPRRPSLRSPLRVFSVSFNFPRRPSLSLWLLKKPRISGVVSFSPRTSMTAERIDPPMNSTAMMGSLQIIGRKQKQRIVEKKRIRRLTNGKGKKNQSDYAGSQLTSLCHWKQLLIPNYHYTIHRTSSRYPTTKRELWTLEY